MLLLFLLLLGRRLFHTLEQRLVLSKFPFVIKLSKVFGLLREVFPLGKRVPLMGDKFCRGGIKLRYRIRDVQFCEAG